MLRRSTRFALGPSSPLPPAPDIPYHRRTVKPTDKRLNANKAGKRKKERKVTRRDLETIPKRKGRPSRSQPPRDLQKGEVGSHPQGTIGKPSFYTIEQRNAKDLAVKKWTEDRQQGQARTGVKSKGTSSGQKGGLPQPITITISDDEEEVNDPPMTKTVTSTSGSDPMKGIEGSTTSANFPPVPKGALGERKSRALANKGDEGNRLKGTTSQDEERSANMDEEEVNEVNDPPTNKGHEFDIWDLAVKEWREERERKQRLGKMSGSETTSGQKGGLPQTITISDDDDGVNNPLVMTLTSTSSDHDPRKGIEGSMNSENFPSSPDQDYFVYDDFYDFDIPL